MILAFSLQSDIKSIGAYAGFAAVIGLALLVLLYFAQARELRRMSDFLEQQEDRLRAAAAQVRAPVPRPAPARAAAPVAAAPVAQPPADVPAEPGTGATATVAVPGVRRVAVGAVTAVSSPDTPVADAPAADATAATITGGVSAATVAGAMAAATPAGAAESKPAAKEPPPGVEDGDPPPASPGAVALRASPPATAEPVGAQAFDVPGFGSRGEHGPETSEHTVVAPAEAEAAAGEEPGAVALFEPPGPEISVQRLGARAEDPEPAPFDHGLAPVAEDPEPPAALAPSTPAGARPRFPPAPGGDGAATPVGVPLRSGGDLGVELGPQEQTSATTRRRGRDEGRIRPGEEDYEARAGGSVLRLLAAAIVIVAVLVFIATRVFGPSTPAKTTGSHSSTSSGLSPASITVAVLNGTPTAGLAARVSSTLAGDGFRPGTVANALSRGHHVTLVGFAPGERAAALVVAKQLRGKVRVGAVDPRTLTAAQGQSAVPPSVVVTLGSDYQSQ